MPETHSEPHDTAEAASGKMGTASLIVLGFILSIALSAGFGFYEKINEPLGALTNEDFPLVQVMNENSRQQFELRKGESKPLDYGNYNIVIPDAKASFVLFKNNRGVCHLHSVNGTLIVEVNRYASVVRDAH